MIFNLHRKFLSPQQINFLYWIQITVGFSPLKMEVLGIEVKNDQKSLITWENNLKNLQVTRSHLVFNRN